MAIKKSNIHFCNGCRTQQEIVLNACGFSYCELCKNKAPTRHQYKEFLNEKIPDYKEFGNHKKVRGKVREGMAAPIDSYEKTRDA
jgi:hypothetical protein